MIQLTNPILWKNFPMKMMQMKMIQMKILRNMRTNMIPEMNVRMYLIWKTAMK